MNTRTVEQNNENIQDTKIEFNKEIESLKKTQTGIKLEMKNSTSSSEVGLTNRSKDMDERMSGLEDKVEEMDSSVKENVKSKNIQAQN